MRFASQLEQSTGLYKSLLLWFRVSVSGESRRRTECRYPTPRDCPGPARQVLHTPSTVRGEISEPPTGHRTCPTDLSSSRRRFLQQAHVIFLVVAQGRSRRQRKPTVRYADLWVGPREDVGRGFAGQSCAPASVSERSRLPQTLSDAPADNRSLMVARVSRQLRGPRELVPRGEDSDATCRRTAVEVRIAR
jgi:hypothetical protein